MIVYDLEVLDEQSALFSTMWPSKYVTYSLDGQLSTIISLGMAAAKSRIVSNPILK
jgi:hypothetical protein